jgi:photosystem II stability/assembly factor-like uncharacterized protein
MRPCGWFGCLTFASSVLLVACGEQASHQSGGGGKSSVGGSSAVGGAGRSNSAGQAGRAAGGSGGKLTSGSGDEAGEAGTGEAGVASGGPDGAGGAIAHGGAPAVDYGDVPTPPASWTNITGTLAGMQSECGNLTALYTSPLVDLLVVGVARQGLWSSVDGGASYARLGASGDMVLYRLMDVAWDPSSADTFYAAGIYGWESPFTDGVFKTTDRGASFAGYKALSAIQSHNDSISVDFSDPERKTLLSGGHEQADVLFLSQDAGKTWTNIRASLPDNLGFCTVGLVLDAKHFLVGCAAAYTGKSGGIVRTTDAGKTWSKVSDKGAVNPPLWAYDGSIYWANEAGGLLKSTDQGLTFTSSADGTSNRASPIELPGGRIVSVANKKLIASADGGKTWNPITDEAPFDPVRIAYSPFQRAFYASQFDCNNAVPPDAIQRYGYDFKH